MGNKCRRYTAYCASKTLADKGGFLNTVIFGLPPSLTTCFLHQLPGIFMSSTSLELNGI